MDYKKILEGVVDIINTTKKSDIGFANICSYIGENCPELKESEDERISKALIYFIKQSEIKGTIRTYLGVTEKEMLAWLEKQKPIGWSEEDSIICQEVIHVIDNCERFEQERNHENCVDFHHYQVLREWLKFLSNKYISQQPKQDEQKPTDKVEPKFKVEKEKWYVCISQYCNCIEGRNYKASLDGRIIDDYGTEYDMHDDAYRWFRPWTIQDAKDGDVLSYSDNRNNVYLCIYREYKNERVYDYCTLDKESFWEHGNWNYLASFNYAPATKEQRDTLFKAMSDAGYTFDFVKKELKKMKQPNWNEEDEYYYGIVQYILNNERVGKADKENASNWFKSIKDRVQPKQEWSEEDEKAINDIMWIIEAYRKNGFNETHVQIADSSENWLKSLKPQNK